ncbi:MAG: hypothetical protein M3P49_09285 [Actinomycetota bacterium]|nr:hypothetical protein [Actinomycetota bacterium]
MVVKARRRTRNRVATTDHSELVLGILYRMGGATVDQVASLMRHADPGRWSTHSAAYEAAKKTCRVLRENGYAEAVGLRRPWAGRTEGRPESFHRLRKGGEGQVEGAIAAGAPGDKASINYRRIWSGGGVAHAAMRVDYVLSLLDGAEAAGVDVDPDRTWSESHPSYPLVGSKLAPADAAGRKIKAKVTARRIYERVVPDGECEIDFGGDVCPVYFEVERRTQSSVVADKIERYAGRWGRVLKDDGVLEARPVIVVHHDARRAQRANPKAGAGAPALASALETLLSSGQGQGHFASLQTEFLRRDEYASLGRMILVCSWDDVAAHGAHAPIYYPVSTYNEEGDAVLPVDLRMAAEERVVLMRGYSKAVR